MVFEKLSKLIAEHFSMDAEEITMDTSFKDIDLDSLDVVELTMALEEEFELPDTPEEELTGIVTVGDLAAYVARAIQG